MANNITIPKKIIGKEIVLDDCNDAIISGQAYRATSSTLNKPFDWDYVHIFCLGATDNNVWQIAMRMNVIPNIIAVRSRMSNGTWGDWKQFSSDDRIVTEIKLISNHVIGTQGSAGGYYSNTKVDVFKIGYTLISYSVDGISGYAGSITPYCSAHSLGFFADKQMTISVNMRLVYIKN